MGPSRAADDPGGTLMGPYRTGIILLTCMVVGFLGCTEESPSPSAPGPETEGGSASDGDTGPGDGMVSDIQEDAGPVVPPWGDGLVHPFSPQEAELKRTGNVIELDLVASQQVHKTPYGDVPGYAYNEVTPGPTIRGRVGDELRVSLTNGLLTPTTIHWHGAHVPWDMDGVVWKMDPVSPGETFLYTFPLTQAGTFWYHPHFDTDSQVDLGLYGMLVVEEEEEAPIDHELLLVFDSFEEVKHQETTEHTHVHGGTIVTTWLVNGALAPEVEFPAGSRVRVRMVNSSNGGYLDLRWPGMRMVAGDQGRFGGVRTPDSLVLVPGERAEVEWRVGSEEFNLLNQPHTLMGGEAYGEPYSMLTVVPVGDAPLPEWGDWGSTNTEVTPDPDYTDIHYVFTGSPRTGQWLINGEEYPDVTVEEVPAGESRIIEIRNLSPSHHPFHMHGVSFEVLSVNGVAPEEKRIEDTMNVGIYEVVRIMATNNNPGEWMVHCHILGHAHNGMMTVIHFLP